MTLPGSRPVRNPISVEGEGDTYRKLSQFSTAFVDGGEFALVMFAGMASLPMDRYPH
jgi:hypothetical protein